MVSDWNAIPFPAASTLTQGIESSGFVPLWSIQ